MALDIFELDYMCMCKGREGGISVHVQEEDDYFKEEVRTAETEGEERTRERERGEGESKRGKGGRK